MSHMDEQWLLQEKYNGEKTFGFFADCAQLETGTPLAYLIGHIPFLTTTIYLDGHPLIPRPETEYWTELAIAEIKKSIPRAALGKSLGRPWGDVRVLDLCAGSGAIGVAVATALPEALVTFAELDASLLPTISKNLSINRKVALPTQQYTLIESDLFTNVTGQFDFILTNPPYIDQAANTVDQNVAEHEPHLALFGGERGLEVIHRIILNAAEYLTPTGQLWIEHEPFQSTQIQQLAAAAGFTTTTHVDQYGTERYSVLQRVLTL